MGSEQHYRRGAASGNVASASGCPPSSSAREPQGSLQALSLAAESADHAHKARRALERVNAADLLRRWTEEPAGAFAVQLLVRTAHGALESVDSRCVSQSAAQVESGVWRTGDLG